MKPPKPAPCSSCPYRMDSPSGLWHPEEYAKLPGFDQPISKQSPSVFLCHRNDDHLCGGWVACHDMEQSLGFKVAVVQGKLTGDDIDAVLDYESPVPVFSNGALAALHGIRGIPEPDERARRFMERISASRKAKEEDSQ